MDWKDKVVLLIGGTGSFGSGFVKLLSEQHPKAIRIYSRDEHKQGALLNEYAHKGNVSGFIGDIRDKDRLQRAMEDVDIVIHAAALKCVQSCEYNPLETIKTNISGSMNIIDVALDHNVEKVLAISSDKAVNPLNLYGATKMCMERLVITANAYRGLKKRTKFCCTRYGNVAGSRGSIIPIWKEMMFKKQPITITNPQATRFWLTLPEANQFVMECLDLMDTMSGGEIFVPKMSSVKVMDVFKALTNGLYQFTIIGDRVGDKLHETLISKEEIKHTVEIGNKYVVYPEQPQYAYVKPEGKECNYKEGYRSDNNDVFLTQDEIKQILG